MDFNPRSPWGERLTGFSGKTATSLFQSTLPVGGATLPLPCNVPYTGISIHAPRGGSDAIFAPNLIRYWQFQSTLPVGGATPPSPWCTPGRGISIHAPRGGSDGLYYDGVTQHNYFNPRSPWGERLTLLFSSSSLAKFQSTLPVGGATC